MGIQITNKTVGLWFVDTIKGPGAQNFLAHVYQDGDRYICQYRFAYAETGTKNWYLWQMNTSDPAAVATRVDAMLRFLSGSFDGPVYCCRRNGRSLDEYYSELLKQPWFHVVKTERIQ